MNEALTFNEMPWAIQELSRKVDILLAEINTKPHLEEDHLMPMEEFRLYLPEKPARQTVYDWILKRKVPYEKFSNSKRVYFRKSTIDSWLSNGRQMTSNKLS